MSEKDGKKNLNIFDLLSEEEPEMKKEKNPKTMRIELLEPTGITDIFKEGTICIDMRKCRGIECNLCVKVCPTSALYWKAGEIGIIKDLCIHCTACVANCMEDNCIQITRKRSDNTNESFSNPKDVFKLQNNICSKKRRNRVKSLYPTIEEFFKRHEK